MDGWVCNDAAGPDGPVYACCSPPEGPAPASTTTLYQPEADSTAKQMPSIATCGEMLLIRCLVYIH